MCTQRLAIAALAVSLLACGPKGEPPRQQAGTGAPDTTATAPAPVPAPAPAVETPAPSPAPSAPGAPSRPPAAAPAPASHPAPARPAAAAPAGAPTPAPAVATRDEWHPPPRDTLNQETYQGWKQYELNCSRCHGEYAVGTSFAPALVVSLKEGGSIPTREAFITTVCAGRPEKGMPAWCALGLEMSKIEQIYLYVKGRADGTYAPGRPALRE